MGEGDIIWLFRSYMGSVYIPSCNPVLHGYFLIQWGVYFHLCKGFILDIYIELSSGSFLESGIVFE